MKILVYGAGVLGSLYAARLQEAGSQVTILARGQRYDDISTYGIVLEDAESGCRTVTQVNVIDHLDPNDVYHLIIVLVRKNQLASILPALAANHSQNMLFMVNNAAGAGELTRAIGQTRVMLGFPGAGGQRDGYVVRYAIAPANTQPTTLGEPDGVITGRLEYVARLFNSAGFPVAICKNMDAWLKTHVAIVSPIAQAIYLAGGDNYRLARTRDGLVLMVRSVREGFKVLRALNIPITPKKYKFLEWVPEPILVAMLQKGFNSRRAELMLAHHANAARDEMRQLAEEFRRLARATTVPTPCLDTLFRFLDPGVPAVPDGQARLALDWRNFLAAVSALMVVVLAIWGINLSRRDNP